VQNAKRELPPCWHMVGPLVIDRHSGDFPPKFGPEDAAVEAFLQAAAGERRSETCGIYNPVHLSRSMLSHSSL